MSYHGEPTKLSIKNDIFLNVVEKLNILVSTNGTVLKSDIIDAVKMRSALSGMPELKLGLNDTFTKP